MTNIICDIPSLESKLLEGVPVQITYELFRLYQVERENLFQNCIVGDRLISHAYQDSEEAYSRRIYFFEVEAYRDWKYFAQLASFFHCSMNLTSKSDDFCVPTTCECGVSHLGDEVVETSDSLQPGEIRGLNEENIMQYLDTGKEGIFISNEIPVEVLNTAIGLIESTEVRNGKKVEVMLADGYLVMDGEGECDDVVPLIRGFSMIQPYVEPGSTIDIDHTNWETTVTLSSRIPMHLSC